MKRHLYILFFIFSVLCGLNSYSQVANYTFSETTGTYTSITGGTQLVTTTAGATTYDTDGSYFTLPAGSQFSFNGTTITSINMTADGSVYMNPITTTTGNGTTGSMSSTATAAGIICGMNMDLRSTSLASQVYERRWQDVGTEVVFQWQNAARYLSDATERFSFQVRVTKSTGVVKVVYGNMTTIANSTTYVPGVGLRGSVNTDFNNRRLTGTVPDATPNWGAPNGTAAGTSNAHTVRFTSASSCFPASGLTFIWTPPSCINPTGLTITFTSSTSANLSWTAPSPAPASGYDWEIRTSGAGGSGATGLVASGSVGAGVTTASTSALTGNTTYTLYVRSNCGSSNYSTWSASASSTSPAPAPSNDACSGATNLACGTSSLAGTTVGSVSETAPLGYSSDYGVWYSFTGDGQQTTISSTAVFDHEMTIMTGSSCGSFVVVSSQDLAIANGTETHTFIATNGQQYYVYIAHYSPGNTTTGTFTISRTCTAPPTPPSNDNCSGSTSLPCGTSNLAGTTVNSVVETAPGGGGLASDYGVWYTFTGNGQQTTISATGTGGFDIEMTVLHGNSCSTNYLINSLDNTGSNGTESLTLVTANGIAYYVYVAYWSSTGTTSDVGTFTISRSCTTVADGPCNNAVAGPSAVMPDEITPSVTSSCPTNGTFTDEYLTWSNALSGIQYRASTTTSTDWITIRTGTPSGTVEANGTQPLTWTSSVTGTIYIHVNSNGGCASGPFCRDVTVERLSALPIELIYLRGESFENYNKLYWATATEINTDYFEIEESLNGFDWRMVAYKKASGYSQSEIKYSINVEVGYPSLRYYKLKQVDLNGEFNYFGILSLENKGKENKKILAYYNLLGQQIKLDNYTGLYFVIYSDGTTQKFYK